MNIYIFEQYDYYIIRFWYLSFHLFYICWHVEFFLSLSSLWQMWWHDGSCGHVPAGGGQDQASVLLLQLHDWCAASTCSPAAGLHHMSHRATTSPPRGRRCSQTAHYCPHLGHSDSAVVTAASKPPRTETKFVHPPLPQVSTLLTCSTLKRFVCVSMNMYNT